MTSTPRLRAAAALFVCATAILASACAGKSINRVLSDPSRYRNEEVKLTGDVVDSYSVASTGAYQIDDGTGRLWVWSNIGVPRKGARVTVTGTLLEAFHLAPRGNLVKLPEGAVLLMGREDGER